MVWDNQSNLEIDTCTDTQKETESNAIRDNQKDSDVIAIDAKTDVEFDMFWDALSNPDTDTEDDVFWDALMNPDTNLNVVIQTNIEDKASWNVPTNVNKDAGVDIQLNDDIFWDLQTKAFIDNQPERRTDEPVLIQSASSNNFLTIWNESNNIKFIDTQSALEKVNSWATTTDNDNMEEADTKKEKADSNPNVIDGNRKSLRRPKVLPYDDDDSSSRKSEKPKHEKSNKHENKKEKRGNCLMTYLICFLILFGQVAFRCLGNQKGRV